MGSAILLLFLLPFLLPASDPALLVRLRNTAEGESAGRDVLGDRRARRHVRPLADLDWRDELRVAADEHVLADRRAVLLLAVVVAGDHPGADVGSRADVGVAEVGQVRRLGPPAQDGVLDLDERADVGVLLNLRAWPQTRERPDSGARADPGPLDLAVRTHGGPRRDLRVEEPREGEDLRPLAHGRLPLQRDERMQYDVRSEPDAGAQPHGRRIEQSHAEIERFVDAPTALHLLRGRQISSSVDAPRFPPVLGLDGVDLALPRDQDLDGIREVDLPRPRVPAQRRESTRQRLGREAVHARVDFPDALLPGRRVGGLDDPGDPAPAVAHDTAELAGVRRTERKEGEVEPAAPPILDEPPQRVRPQERRIAGEDEHRTVPRAEDLVRPASGIARS